MTVVWRTLSAQDLDAVRALARRCLDADGGLPETVSAAFLGRRYAGAGVTAIGAVDNGALVAAGAVRPVPGGGSAVVGHVDPGGRGRGLGGELLDRLLRDAGGRPGAARVETESLTPATRALFESRGLRQSFAEDVLRRDLTVPLPAAPLPAGLTLATWADDTQEDFYAAYRASFADRPGVPDWSLEEWVGWTVDDEFLPGSSFVAGTAGFVTCAEGFLIQTGVVPGRRRRGLGRALVVAALERMRAGGAAEVHLDVNADNPASAAMFAGIGFTVVARRARYA